MNIENQMIINESGNIQYTSDEDKLKEIEEETDEESDIEDVKTCNFCFGEGQVYETTEEDPDNGEISQCRACNGSGQLSVYDDEDEPLDWI